MSGDAHEDRVQMELVLFDVKPSLRLHTEEIGGFDRSIHTCDVAGCRRVPRIRWLPQYRDYWWDLCSVHFVLTELEGEKNEV